jgi:hypothetical protein
MNVIFGVASFWGSLWFFVLIRGIDGYIQSFGAPGMVAINATFHGAVRILILSILGNVTLAKR